MGNCDSRRCKQLAENELKKILAEPTRRRLESLFAQAHSDDTDEELLTHLLDLKRQYGARLKAADVIGYTYLTQRLGPWPQLMTEVNQRLAAEKRGQAANLEQ